MCPGLRWCRRSNRTHGCRGNVTGGVIASRMGLPVKIVCAVNENDIIHRTLSTGDFSKRETVKQTLSPAIDIQNPYNLERIFWLFSNDDCELIGHLFSQLESSGAVNIPEDLLQRSSKVVSSFGCDDAAVKATMQRCWKENKYLLCPHTAVGVACYYQKLTKMEGGNVTRRRDVGASPPMLYLGRDYLHRRRRRWHCMGVICGTGLCL
ncbi:putative threonine synthase-like 2 isoform X12 [Apostichopus japonicus]|uniref:Putative threonine synthase-like 2 isoform X12 n=1 Tax=Stichopus japonicus TaxID=307972 RepID=A0A2G8K2H1_STIJA|nr:putative threonine synthase-like 2 isoform X12 [Apostichopus japonicus]